MANEAINASAGRQTATSTMTAPRSPCCRCVYRSEEHTSELQSQSNLVCRLLLEKKKRFHNRDATEIRCAQTEILNLDVVVARRGINRHHLLGWQPMQCKQLELCGNLDVIPTPV